MKIFFSLIFLLFSTFIFSVHSQEFQFSSSEIKTITPISLRTYYSLPGEGISDFVRRIAPELAQWTNQTGYEVCGEMAVTTQENDGQTTGIFSVNISTLQSHIACVNSFIEPGYQSFQRTLHTHPQKKTIKLSALDMKILNKPNGKLLTRSISPCRFSEHDYNYPGYLITCDQILYQHGKNTDISL